MTTQTQTNPLTARALAIARTIGAAYMQQLPGANGNAAQVRAALNAYTKAGYELAGGLDVRDGGGLYYVPSRTTSSVYAVDLENDVCSCQHGTTPGAWCWHKAAAQAFERAQVAAVADADPFEDADAPFNEADYSETVVEVIDMEDVGNMPGWYSIDPLFWDAIDMRAEALETAVIL